MNDIEIKDVMTHLVVTLRPKDSIPEAAKLMLDNRISGAPVVERGRLVGVLSESDLVAAYRPPGRSGRPPTTPDPLMFLLKGREPGPVHRPLVEDVMTKEVVTISPEASLWEAASLIEWHGVRRLPVVDKNGHVVGVLARADLVRSMARSDDEVASAARKAIEELGEENFTSLSVGASAGEVTISGVADRRSTHDLALRIVTHVPGVLEVMDELDWGWDDRDVQPTLGPRDPHDTRTIPWTSGPLVKDG